VSIFILVFYGYLIDGIGGITPNVRDLAVSGCGILSETSLLMVWRCKYIQAEKYAGCQIIIPLM